ncbi:MAG: DUF3786 domain-containing protein [Deltaproteobacteria bacterium]|nr:DUF3786 domain-containing protein [Deltaproteobacteria bacterium]
MKSVLEIVKATPKTNCKACGQISCMAFAVAVMSGKLDISACPHIVTPDSAAGSPGPSASLNADTALLRELQAKIREVRLEDRAAALGAEVVYSGNDAALRLSYLGKTVLLSKERIVPENDMELDPRDQILLYNYVFFASDEALSGDWVGLEAFPNSISKVVTLRRYTEEKLADAFDGRLHELMAILAGMSGVMLQECHADLCAQVSILPKVPVQVHFWNSSQEDGFTAQAKVLFDANAMRFLDIESLVFAAERMAEMCLQQIGLR